MNTVMELEIGPGPQPGSYVVHVLQSVGAGEPSQVIALDFDDLIERRPLLEATVLSSSVSARRVMSDTEAVVQDVGRRLFESTFSGDIRTAYRTSMAVASERGKGVQIALRLTAPGLAALPWEALFDEESGIYLCRKEPLVRYVPAPHSPPTLTIEPPMRVLGMISSPRGLPALDVGGEKERLEAALKPHLESGRVVLEWLDDVTWTGVHEKLLEDPWHVLHFVGHGTYDIDTDEGVLAFVGRDGRADYVTASSLADLLDEAEPTPRLVVLNSCQSGAGGTTDLFSGTAAALAHSGIRAVAAMQFSISDDAAIEFARGFYTALSHGRGIDEAVRSGRIGILGMGRGTLEWVTPVLYLRGEDTRLFDVAPMPASTDAATDALPDVPAADAEAEADAADTGAPNASETSEESEISGASGTPDATEATETPVASEATEATDATDATEGTDDEMPSPQPATEPTKQPLLPTAPVSRSEAGIAPTADDSPEAPWWVKPTTTQPIRGGTGKPAGADTPQPPSRPPTRPVPKPAPVPDPKPRVKPWLVVSLIALVAIGAGVATVALLRPPAVEQILTGVPGNPLGEDEIMGSPSDLAAPWVKVKDEVIPLTLDDWKYTGHFCTMGAEYRITAHGEGSMHDGVPVGPEGLGEGESSEAPSYPAFPLASLLVGVRGSDTLVYVGSDGSYTCPSGSEMKLGVNDLNVEANSGQFNATIWKLSEQ